MEMKVYHCMDPEENPLPSWMRVPRTSMGLGPQETNRQAEDPVQQFKANPDAFFPEFIKSRR